MRLATLIEDLRRAGHSPHIDAPGIALGEASGATEVEIDDVVHDSRQAAPGVLFCAVPGAKVDGHDFAVKAVQAGAPALLVERAVALDTAAVPQLVVSHMRSAMATAAGAVHRRPSEHIAVVGITGTNGKTTTTHLLASVMRGAGSKVEIVGTLSGVHTTPEATDLQRQLRRYVDDGVDVVAAEISSHALDQHRADAVTFAVAAFSNLTPDHLDYHGDMATYFQAKRRLFDGRAGHELINIDDDWGQRLAALRPDARTISLSDVDMIESGRTGSRFRWRGFDVNLAIPGTMNVANALMAAEAGVLLGVEAEVIAVALSNVAQVPGRMQVVTTDADPVTVIVDYSHTPDSIERALRTIRASSPGVEITIVFGCGGDRDRAKRPLMAHAAEAGADRVILTNDNPRSEDPDAIIAQAIAGMTDPGAAIVQADRRAAIATALMQARPGGVVLIAGKGHESTQTIGDQVLDFDDVQVAKTLLHEVTR